MVQASKLTSEWRGKIQELKGGSKRRKMYKKDCKTLALQLATGQMTACGPPESRKHRERFTERDILSERDMEYKTLIKTSHEQQGSL